MQIILRQYEIIHYFFSVMRNHRQLWVSSMLQDNHHTGIHMIINLKKKSTKSVLTNLSILFFFYQYLFCFFLITKHLIASLIHHFILFFYIFLFCFNYFPYANSRFKPSSYPKYQSSLSFLILPLYLLKFYMVLAYLTKLFSIGFLQILSSQSNLKTMGQPHGRKAKSPKSLQIIAASVGIRA